MPTKVVVEALNKFSPMADAHFRNAATALERAINDPAFNDLVLEAKYKETRFKPSSARTVVRKTPAEILAIITGGIERGSTADGQISLKITRDDTIKPDVVGVTTTGRLPFRTAGWFIDAAVQSGDLVSPARHMIHEWLHVAGFVHKRNNGWRPDVAYLVGGIVRTILLDEAKVAATELFEDPELAKAVDASVIDID